MSQSRIIPLHISLPESAGAEDLFQQKAIALGAETYATGLIEDLGIDGQIKVTLGSRNSSRKPFDLRIDDQDARIDLTAAKTAWPEHVCTEIYRNRKLFVTAKMAGSRAHGSKIKRQEMKQWVRQNRPVDFIQNSQQPQAIVGLNTESYFKYWSFEREEKTLMSVQKAFFNKTGIPCSLPVVTTDNRLGIDEFQITLNSVRLSVCRIAGDDPIADIAGTLEREMISAPGCFLTREILSSYLDQIKPLMPRLVEFIVAEIGIEILYEVIIHLVEEGVCVRNFDAILNIFTRPQRLHNADEANFIIFGPEAEPPIMTDSRTLEIADWVRFVRSNFKREISLQYSKFTGISGTALDHMLNVYLLDRSIEQQIEAGASQKFLQQVLYASHEQIGGKSAIMLTTEIVRRKYWELVHRELPRVSVLAYQELSPYLSITTNGRISI